MQNGEIMKKQNFIPPQKEKPSDNYYCTWNTQNFGRYDAVSETDGRVFLDTVGAKKARTFLNEKHLTDQNGFLNQYESVRSEIWFLIDDGWDVPYGINPDTDVDKFGSLAVSADRFPSCTGTPAERLKKLNGIVKKAGWRGLGIWVASQAVGEGWQNYLSEAESEEYWKKRLIETNFAGVGYWKIDWGCHQFDVKWHQMIEKLAKIYAPELTVEHAYPYMPLNNFKYSEEKQITDGRFLTDHVSENWKITAGISSVFRTYDVLAQLSQVTTVDRVATMLFKISETNCILNCEDEVYIAASMGLLMGVMRSGMNKKIPVFNFDPQNVSQRLLEVVRAVRWQRIAPAFPACENEVKMSSEIIKEYCFFDNGDTWFGDALGKTVLQSCPAVVCRGIDLNIEYKEEQKPIILACRNPNGAISMAALSRLSGNNQYRTPLCTPIFFDLNVSSPIGVFGNFYSVVLNYKKPLSGYSVWIQDLAADEAVCVDKEIFLNGNRLEIPGDLLRRICSCSDESEPGALIKIIKKFETALS